MSEWKEVKLKEYLRVSSGEGLPDAKMKPGQYPVYGGNGITGFHNEFLFVESKLIIGRVGALCGNVHITQNKSWITDNALIVSFINNNQDISFWYYLLSNLNLREYAFQSAQPVITGGIIEKIKINIPVSISERNYIAKIISTCDTVIERTQSAISKYKAIKQGMLHDLFTRGLDPNRKLRPVHQDAPELYKETELGWIPREWEVKRLDSIVENCDGKRIPVKQGDRDNQAKIYPYYGASGIIDYVNNYIFDDELILLGEDGENVLSRNLTLAFMVSGKIWVNNHAHVLKPLPFMDIGFLTAALELIDYTPIVSGSAQPKITQKELNKLLVTKPNKQEQSEIAKRLSTINNKLKSEEALLQKYQKIKRGLMGDLLGGKKKVKN